jgi:hypothetical protein
MGHTSLSHSGSQLVLNRNSPSFCLLHGSLQLSPQQPCGFLSTLPPVCRKISPAHENDWRGQRGRSRCCPRVSGKAQRTGAVFSRSHCSRKKQSLAECKEGYVSSWATSPLACVQVWELLVLTPGCLACSHQGSGSP